MKRLTLLFLLLAFQSYGQELTETKSIFQNFDQIRDLKFINETRVMVSATVFNNGNLRTLLTSFNNGNPLTNAFSLTSQGANILSSTSVTSGGNVILSGMAVVNEEISISPTVVKLTPEGSVIWTSSFQGQGFGFAKDVIEMESGQLSGITFNYPFSQSTFFTMDSDGSLLEQEELFIDGEAALLIHNVYLGNQTSIYAGVFPDPNAEQLLPFVAKLVNGSVEWCKTYDSGIVLSETDGPDFLMDVAEDGSIFLATTHSSVTGPNGNEMVLTKLDAEGDVIWSKISDSTPTAALGLFVESSVSGEVWFGFSYITDEADMVVSRWDETGEATVFVTSNTSGRLLTRMVEKEDQTLVMAGANLVEEDSYVVEVGPNGEFPCGFETQTAFFTDNTVTVNGRSTELFPVAIVPIPGEMSSIVVPIETIEMCSITLGTAEEESAFFDVYPNPVQDALTVNFRSAGIHRIIITDITGREVVETVQSGGQAQIDMSTLARGVYLVQADGQSRRVVKE